MIDDYCLNEAIRLIKKGASEVRDSEGNSEMFNFLGLNYGPIAYTIFRLLHRSNCPVLLHPWLVYNRTKCCDVDPSYPEFWNHGDMIVGLNEFLEFARCEEGINGKIYTAPCAQG